MSTLAEVAGWLPAIILPVSTGLQLFHLAWKKKAEDISATAWALFGVANLGAYFMAPENYGKAQSILAFLLSAVLDVWIVVLIFKYRRRDKAKKLAAELQEELAEADN